MKGESRTLRGQVVRQDRRIEERERKDQLNTAIVDGLIRNHYLPLKTDVAIQLSNTTQVKFDDTQTANVYVTKQSRGNDQKSYLVRFKDIDVKRDVIRSKGLLKPTQIFVKEHLTPTQDAIFIRRDKRLKAGY